MANFEITGTIEVIYDTQVISDKFSKREFVLGVPDGDYTDYPKFQLVNDNAAILDNFTEGEPVKVMFSLKCRPYEKNGVTNYWTNVQAWKIEATNPEFKKPEAPAPETEAAPEDMPF